MAKTDVNNPVFLPGFGYEVVVNVSWLTLVE